MNHSWLRRSVDAIHQGALTNSKRPECFVKGVYPSHVTRGNGCHLYDTEDKRYIDYICALGTNLFGYGNIEIAETIMRQLHKGLIYSLSSTLEVEAAEKIKEVIPFAGKVRFLKTGTESCIAALRIALAHTGRSKILSHGYHGWADAFVGLTPPALGILKTDQVETLSSLDQITEETAAVIVEPVITEYSEERIKYLQALRDKCTKTGAILIFDEIITGFRFKNLTVSQDTGIFPDIICLGKAIGGGLPLSIVATKPGIGDNQEWFVSGTFAGDTLALATMMKCIEMLRSTHKIERLWEAGQRFQTQFNEIDLNIVKIEGYPSRGVLVAEPMNKALFFQEACKAGILFGPSFFYNFDHILYNDIVLNSCRDIINRIKNKAVQLEGELPKSPFAQRMRESQQ